MGNKERVGEKHLLINALETRDIKAYSHSLGLHGGEKATRPSPPNPLPSQRGQAPSGLPIYSRLEELCS